MFDIEPPSHAERWRGFEPTEEDDAKALEECEAWASRAEADESYLSVCLAGEKVFYVDYPYGLMPGHIYSELGMDEFRISGSCEYHFDEWTKDPDESKAHAEEYPICYEIEGALITEEPVEALDEDVDGSVVCTEYRDAAVADESHPDQTRLF